MSERLERLKRLYRLDDSDTMTMKQIAKEYIQMRQYDDAKKYIKIAIEKSPYNFSYYMILAETYVLNSEMQKAIDYLNEIIIVYDKPNPRNKQTLNTTMACSYHLLGDTENTEVYMEKAIRNNNLPHIFNLQAEEKIKELVKEEVKQKELIKMMNDIVG